MQIVAINRTGSRSILNMPYFLAALRSIRGANVRVYQGNEGIREAVQLFAPADVVIGFHGAGFINCMWSKAGSLALEISALQDWNGTKKWRTNRRVATHHGRGLRWVTYWLRLQSIIGQQNITEQAYNDVQDKDHWLKANARASIETWDMINIVDMIKEHIEHQSLDVTSR